MTDIRAAIERLHARPKALAGSYWHDVQIVTDFAAARLAEPAKGEPVHLPCPQCGGSGYVPDIDMDDSLVQRPCDICGGGGSLGTIELPVPPVAPEPPDEWGINLTRQGGPMWTRIGPTPPVAPEPPDGLVERLTELFHELVLRELDSSIPPVGEHDAADAILAALAGRIVGPGMIAVRVDRAMRELKSSIACIAHSTNEAWITETASQILNDIQFARRYGDA